MLHPHVPEELKHFGKHLFATFLGLLMALGLEQWREHHMEQKLTAQAVAQVEAELRLNLKEARRVVKDEGLVLKSLQTKKELIQDYMKTPITMRRPMPELEGLIGSDCAWVQGAWENLKAMGALRHMDPDRALRWSGLYAGMTATGEYLQQNAAQIPLHLFIQFPEQAWPKLSKEELSRMFELMNQLEWRMSHGKRLASNVIEHIEADLNRSAQAKPHHTSFLSSSRGLAITIPLVLLAVFAAAGIRKRRKNKRSQGDTEINTPDALDTATES